MAYSTGTGLTIADFVDALKVFAAAQGWTVGKYDTASGERLLFIEQGACHVAMRWDDSFTVNAYPTASLGSSSPVDDHRIRAVLGTGLNNARTSADWWQQTGQTVATSENDANNLTVNNLAGPFTAWYLFSNAGGTYIHAIVQTGELFTHMSFGVLDQGALTHGGVAYLTGTLNTWWKTANTLDPSNFGITYNRPASLTRYPAGNGGEFPENHGMWYAPDALPAGFPTLHSYQAKVSPSLSFLDKPSDTFAASWNRLLTVHALANGPTWSDVVQLFGVPLILQNTAEDQFCVPGFMPDLRLVNMEGMSPGEEIDMNGDTWKVFPQMRQTNWADVAAVMAPSSGQFAVAYKKIP